MHYLLLRAIINPMAQRAKHANLTGRVGIGPSPHWRLERFVDALNGKLRAEDVLGQEEYVADQRRITETPIHLRKIVHFLQESGSRRVWPSAMAELWQEINQYFQNMPKQLISVPGGGATIWWNSRPDMNPKGEALRWFVEFLMNPECHKLAGPCDRCDKYYIRKSARNKRYCSRSCGSKTTAAAATKRARQQEHEQKLARARERIQDYAKSRTKLSWKQWVALKGDITPKFLTRAVNKGELQEPVRSSRKEK